MKKLTSFIIKLFSYLLCCFFAFGNYSWGYEQGELTPYTPHIYNIDIETMNITDNRFGAEVLKTWDLRGVYAVWIHCEKQAIPPSARVTRVYSATTSMVPSSINPGFLHLNDYLDVKVRVLIRGERNQLVTAPFYDETNKQYGDCTPPKTLNTYTQSGSKGEVTFKITKPFINGISIDNYELVKIFGALGPHTPLDNAITTVQIRSGILTVPDKCVVNAGQPISVEFGDIPGDSDRLNGNNFRQDVPIKIQCKGGSFTTGNLDIKLSVQPSGSGLASFNPAYLGTTGAADRSNLGIVLREKANNDPVVPGTFYNLKDFNNNTGSWNLTAAPIAKPGTEIPAGDFDASASVVAEFQ